MIFFESKVDEDKPKEKNKLPEVQNFCLKVFLRRLKGKSGTILLSSS